MSRLNSLEQMTLWSITEQLFISREWPVKAGRVVVDYTLPDELAHALENNVEDSLRELSGAFVEIHSTTQNEKTVIGYNVDFSGTQIGVKDDPPVTPE